MSNKYKPWEPDGFNYRNLENYMLTGCNLDSECDRPDWNFKLTDQFVNDIQSLHKPTRANFVELGNKYGTSHYVPECYYKAHAIMTGKQVANPKKTKLLKVTKEDYERTLLELEELKEKLSSVEKSERMYKEETSELRTENIHLKNRLEEYKIKTKKAIQEIGYQRWTEL